MKKTIIPFAVLLSSLLIFSACEKNEYDDLGPDKSVWSNGNFNGSGGTNDPGEDSVTKESSIEVNFSRSSDLAPLTGLITNTLAFPVIRENENPNSDYFRLATNPSRLGLVVQVPKGLFNTGPALELSTIENFSYNIFAERRDGNFVQISSDHTDTRLDYARIKFWEYTPEKIRGLFQIGTWIDNGNGQYDQHHACEISFTLYPTDNQKLFDQ